MENFYLYLFIIAITFLFYYRLTAENRQKKFIETYHFPLILEREVLYNFNETQKQEILEGLRAYFLILNQANNAKFFVPSQIILHTWRAFIALDEYNKFSQKAFAILITPPLRRKKINKDTLRNAFKTVWSLSQEQEGIKDKRSRKLPSLFSLDKELKIQEGILYRFKKNKTIKSLTQEASFSLTYSSEEYVECSLELGTMKLEFSSEKNMSEYSDNVNYNSSGTKGSDSSDNNNSSGTSSSWFSSDDSSGSSSSSDSSGD